jgi:hypothetical protein
MAKEEFYVLHYDVAHATLVYTSSNSFSQKDAIVTANNLAKANPGLVYVPARFLTPVKSEQIVTYNLIPVPLFTDDKINESEPANEPNSANEPGQEVEKQEPVASSVNPATPNYGILAGSLLTKEAKPATQPTSVAETLPVTQAHAETSEKKESNSVDDHNRQFQQLLDDADADGDEEISGKELF